MSLEHGDLDFTASALPFSFKCVFVMARLIVKFVNQVYKILKFIAAILEIQNFSSRNE